MKYLVNNPKINALYEKAKLLLKTQGFYFCHSYWIFSDQNWDESPGISVGWSPDGNSLAINAVVQTDYFSETIYVSDESTMKSVITALALVIKFSHEKLQKTIEEYTND